MLLLVKALDMGLANKEATVEDLTYQGYMQTFVEVFLLSIRLIKGNLTEESTQNEKTNVSLVDIKSGSQLPLRISFLTYILLISLNVLKHLFIKLT